ncbi:MAG: hypothetical protein ACXWDM_14605 [Nocardioides sp.]
MGVPGRVSSVSVVCSVMPRLHRVRALISTPELVAAARDSCPDPAFVGFVGVCAYAGLRLGEAAGLQVGDVDFLRREIKAHRQVKGRTRREVTVVPPKAGSARTVYVSDELVELLSRHVTRLRDVGRRGLVVRGGRAAEPKLSQPPVAAHPHSTPTITLDTYSHLWPKSEDRTRAAAASLWVPEDSGHRLGL